ncbi:hypothetical protein AB0E08_08995 [Streptomyces sp. NPDC048281]|uniref:hypothetical protein n=1 Tax=Streptomyces sp. NPDC048281 TaxID=3154715 RepID=UPI00343CEC4D
MAYEVVTAKFRTELHARWSIFFDHLQIPWAYEPVTFYDAKGAPRTPSFWLPRQQIWFDAEPQAPQWWGRFAMAAAASTRWARGYWGETAEPCLPVDVPEEWQGLPLLAEGVLFPDDEWEPWQAFGAGGMRTYDEEPYQWTMCPQCGAFGATFLGSAERLSCDCLDHQEQRRVDGHSDRRLLLAYRAALAEVWHPDQGFEETLLLPTVREALVGQAGAAAAQESCTGECQSLWGQRCEDLPTAAFRGAPDPGTDRLCAQCPGIVCGQCGEQSASALDVPCRVCEPVTLLSENFARQRLNGRVEQLASVTGRHGRAVNILLNEAIGVKTRKSISLAQLGAALTHVEQWLEDPSSMPTGQPAVSGDSLERAQGAELRNLLAGHVGPLAKAFRMDIPLVQQRLNDWMGASSRAEATDEQLRDAILQASAWLADPTSYYAYITPQAVEPGGLPAPIHTKPAPADSACSLCAAPVASGEIIGRMPTPRQPFVAMASLCAHCLFDRRAKPRLTDVLLRVFHQVFSGSTTVSLNTAEARVLSEALSQVPTETADDHLREAIDALHTGIDANDPAMPLGYRPASAAVGALRAAMPAMDVTDAATVTAVAKHLAEWEHNPNGLDPEKFASSVQWRQAILMTTYEPTDLSKRGGPFWV